MLLTLKTKLYAYYITQNPCIRPLASSPPLMGSASTMFHIRSLFMIRSPERQTNTNRVTVNLI